MMRIAKSNHGMSLVEIMVVAGLVGMTALAISSLGLMATKTQKSAEVSSDLTALKSYINNALALAGSNPAFCSSILNITPLDSLVSLNVDQGTFQLKKISGAPTPMPSPAPPKAGRTIIDMTSVPAGMPYKYSPSLQINQVFLQASGKADLTGPGSTYPVNVNLVIDASKILDVTSPSGTPAMFYPIPLTLTVNKAGFTLNSCSPQSYQAPCSSPGEAYVIQADGSQACKKIACSAGQYPVGVNDAGNLMCCQVGTTFAATTGTQPDEQPICCDDSTPYFNSNPSVRRCVAKTQSCSGPAKLIDLGNGDSVCCRTIAGRSDGFGGGNGYLSCGTGEFMLNPVVDCVVGYNDQATNNPTMGGFSAAVPGYATNDRNAQWATIRDPRSYWSVQPGGTPIGSVTAHCYNDSAVNFVAMCCNVAKGFAPAPVPMNASAPFYNPQPTTVQAPAPRNGTTTAAVTSRTAATTSRTFAITTKFGP